MIYCPAKRVTDRKSEAVSHSRKNYLVCIFHSEPKNNQNPVTFYQIKRLYIVIYIMTVKDYNRSVEEYADSVYRLSWETLKMRSGQMTLCRTAMKSFGEMLQRLNMW